MKISIFDIDGTITTEGNDSWYKASLAMAENKESFLKALAIWKEDKKKDPVGASLVMMNTAVSLAPKNMNSKDLYDLCYSQHKEYFKWIKGCLCNDKLSRSRRKLFELSSG
jgi:hypothetical protein